MGKTIIESVGQNFTSLRIHIGGDLRAHAISDMANIINAMALIRMIVGKKDRVQMFDPGSQELRTQIRRGIDKDRCRLRIRSHFTRPFLNKY